MKVYLVIHVLDHEAGRSRLLSAHSTAEGAHERASTVAKLLGLKRIGTIWIYEPQMIQVHEQEVTTP